MESTEHFPVPSLLPIRQQRELLRPHEDWTGIVDPSLRRKLQNRLHQRAWRRRQAQERRSQPLLAQKEETLQAPLGIPTSSSTHFEASRRHPNCDARSAVTKLMKLISFENATYQNYLLGSPRTDLLLTLIKFNVFRALFDNSSTLGFSLDWVQTDDAISPFYRTIHSDGVDDSEPTIASPSHLQPTPLQRTVKHHPWIDLLPIPQMRDNILRRGEAFDDSELCFDIVELCGGDNERSGLLVWGDPWSLRSWEIGDGFSRNWASLLDGCWELRASTNYWRSQRGQRKLFPEAMCSIST